MVRDAAYTNFQHAMAVNLAAVLGWVAVSVWSSAGSDAFWQPDFWLLAFVIGLPVSMLFCWALGAAFLKKRMQNPISLISAMIIGVRIAGIMAVIFFVIGRFMGLLSYLDKNSGFQIGGGDYIREIDGILTIYGWLILFQESVVFIFIGGVIGLLVRVVIGGGRQKNFRALDRNSANTSDRA